MGEVALLNRLRPLLLPVSQRLGIFRICMPNICGRRDESTLAWAVLTRYLVRHHGAPKELSSLGVPCDSFVVARFPWHGDIDRITHAWVRGRRIGITFLENATYA